MISVIQYSNIKYLLIKYLDIKYLLNLFFTNHLDIERIKIHWTGALLVVDVKGERVSTFMFVIIVLIIGMTCFFCKVMVNVEHSNSTYKNNLIVSTFKLSFPSLIYCYETTD